MWHEDKWRPLVVSFTNLGLNIIMVQYIGLFGILLSTILSTVFVGMPWLIYNLFTVIFKKKPMEYISRMLFYSIISCGMCVVTYLLCSKIILSGVLGFIVKGIVVFIVSNLSFLLLTFYMPEFNETMCLMKKILKRNF